MGRRRGRGQGQRLLYWFRTPPGVRVGRAPIDEEAIRLLEQHNPDIEFDWTRILKDPPPDPAVRRDRDSRERDRRERRDSRPVARPRPPEESAPAAVISTPAPLRDPQAAVAERRAAAHAAVVLEATEATAPEFSSTDADAPLASGGESLAVEHREPLAADHAEYVEYAAASASVGEHHSVEAAEPPEPRDTSAAALRLGAEGLVRLRARYAEVMARIGEKPMEEPEREELKSRAERLNPDGWVTADEVGAALEQYEAVFESVRAVVGRYPGQRRRRR